MWKGGDSAFLPTPFCRSPRDGSAQRNAPPRVGPGAGRFEGYNKIPAMTDFRAKGTIMGPTGLTAVFGRERV